MIIKKITPLLSLNDWYKGNNNNLEQQILEKLLQSRVSDTLESFLNPNLKDCPDPGGLKDIAEATELFFSTIKEKKKILIVGDYDVDGITSTAVLIRFFKQIGYSNFDSFIPNRFKHGYGLTEKAISDIVKFKPDLIITVDNGITAREEVKILADAGIKLIVTDHHLPLEGMTPDCLVINPQQEDCSFPDKSLAGVGVIFMFIIALRRLMRQANFWNDKCPEPNLTGYLDLVAMGTTADQVPLTNLNRIFVSHGLKVISQQLTRFSSSEFTYLKEFFTRRNISKVDTETLSFQLAPLLNAAGRMGEALEAVKFITSTNQREALHYFNILNSLNQERKEKEYEMSSHAEFIVEDKFKDEAGIVIFDQTFHEGIIGIVASRMVEKFSKPTIILTEKHDEPGKLKASCRSVQGLNILNLLEESQEYLERFGGHSGAAGLTLEAKNLEKFTENFIQICGSSQEKIEDSSYQVDMELTPEMINQSLINRLKILEPHGQQNPKPVFMIRNVLMDQPFIMAEKHLKWNLTPDVEMICWNAAEGFPRERRFDIAFTLNENIYRGQIKKQLIIKKLVPIE